MSTTASLLTRLRGRAGIARNTAITGTSNLIRLLVGFLLFPLLLDGIGQNRTGLFLFTTTLTGYFTAVELSVNASVTRYIAEHRARDAVSDIAATLRNALLVMAGFGAVAAVVLALLGVFVARALFGEAQLRGVAEPALLITAVTSLLYWPSRIGVAALNGIERYDRSAEIQIATSLLLLAGLGALAAAHRSVLLLIGFYGVITVLEGLLAAALAWRELGVTLAWARGRWFGGEHLGGVARFGAAAFVIGIGDTLLNSFDRAIVGAIVGAVAIVGYDVAQRPQQAVRTIAGLSGLALVSPIARLWTLGRRREMTELVDVASFVSIVIAAPVAVLVIVLAHPIIAAWLGHRYVTYVPYLDIFTSFWVLNCSTAALSSALYGIGRLETYARIFIVMSVISLPLSVGLTFAWGTVGVIWGTVIPATLAFPVFVVCSLRLLQMPMLGFVRRVLVPGYGIVGAWTLAVLAAKLLLEPTGYAGLAAFAAIALPAGWGLAAPALRRRLRAAGAVRAGLA